MMYEYDYDGNYELFIQMWQQNGLTKDEIDNGIKIMQNYCGCTFNELNNIAKAVINYSLDKRTH